MLILIDVAICELLIIYQKGKCNQNPLITPTVDCNINLFPRGNNLLFAFVFTKISLNDDFQMYSLNKSIDSHFILLFFVAIDWNGSGLNS